MQTTVNNTTYKRTDFNDRLSVFTRLTPKPQPTTPLRRSLIRAGAKWICSKCGSDRHLQAHHKIKAVYSKNDKGHRYQDCLKTDNRANNGQVVCRDCHRDLHK